MGDEKKLKVYAIGSDTGFFVIRYAGVFDILDLLGSFKKWCVKRYYDVADKEHEELVKSSGKELTFVFEGERKITDYVKYQFQVRIKILRLIDVMVDTAEGKMKKQQAEVDIGVKSWLAKNYKGTFKPKEKSKIQEFFRQVYEQFIAKNSLDDLKTKLTNETLMLTDELKATLNVPRK